MIFNDRIGEVAEKFLSKGRKVYVQGSLRTRKWTDQAGQDHYSTEVVISRFRGDLVLLDSQPGRSDDTEKAARENTPTVNRPPGELNDDIPF